MGESTETQSTILLLARIESRLSIIEISTSSSDRTLNGNGKPGLIEDHRKLQQLVESHLEQAKQDTEARTLLARETQVAKELLAAETKTALGELAVATAAKKEKISARTWAVTMLVIAAFLSLLGGQIVLYLQQLRTP